MTDFETTRSKVTNLIAHEEDGMAVRLFTGDHEQAQDLADKIIAVVQQDARRDANSYGCQHCRDGKDLPPGYQCNKCGTDNPR